MIDRLLGPIIKNNIFTGNTTAGIDIIESTSTCRGAVILENVFYGNGIGIKVSKTTPYYFATQTIIINNQFVSNTTYGISSTTTDYSAYPELSIYADFNNFYGNGTAARYYFPVGPNDTAVDPVFTNAAGGNFGVSVIGTGWPNYAVSATTSSVNIGASQSSIDEASRNTDPGEANVRNATTWKLLNVTKTGTAYIPTAANTRFGVNVDATTGTCVVPVAADVKLGVSVDVSDTGTYDPVSTAATASSVQSDDYSISQTEQCTISATVSNTPDSVMAKVNGKSFVMVNTSGTTWAVTVYGHEIGICSGETITVTPCKAGSYGVCADAPSTITVTAATNKRSLLLSEMRASYGVTYTLTLEDGGSGSDLTPLTTLVSVKIAPYAEATVDTIVNTAISNYSGWTGVSLITQENSPVDATYSIVYFKVTHT